MSAFAYSIAAMWPHRKRRFHSPHYAWLTYKIYFSHTHPYNRSEYKKKSFLLFSHTTEQHKIRTYPYNGASIASKARAARKPLMMTLKKNTKQESEREMCIFMVLSTEKSQNLDSSLTLTQLCLTAWHIILQFTRNTQIKRLMNYIYMERRMHQQNVHKNLI